MAKCTKLKVYAYKIIDFTPFISAISDGQREIIHSSFSRFVVSRHPLRNIFYRKISVRC